MVLGTLNRIVDLHPRAEWLLRGANQHAELDAIDADAVDLDIGDWSAIHERIKSEEK